MRDDLNEIAPSGQNGARFGAPNLDQRLAKAKATVARIRGVAVIAAQPSVAYDDVIVDAQLTGLLAALAAGSAPPANVGAAMATVAHSDHETAAGDEVATPLATPPVLVPTKPASDTLFPVAEDDVALDVPDPVRALNALARRLLGSKDYRSERAEYCRLHLQLNRIGLLAPAFRPQVVCGVKRGDPVLKVLLRDQLVVDYHWCHATRMLLQPQEQEHAALLDLDYPFDFARASTLACKQWRQAFRASEAMVMTVFQQCQLLRLRGQELQGRERALNGSYKASNGQYSNRVTIAKRKIRSWLAGRPAMEAQIPVYEYMWISRELLGPEEAKWIPKLVALSLGQACPRNRKTISEKLRTMDAHVKV